MKPVAMVPAPQSVARFLAALGEPSGVPRRSPSRGAALLKTHLTHLPERFPSASW